MGGNALTEIRTWKWMYNNPDATVNELKNAVLGISADIWNNYFSENFGGARDCSILSVYNHFITGDLYLFNYFIGGIVSYQLADAFERDELAPGLKESCREGVTLPELWMQKAVGSGFSLDPLLNGVSGAVEYYSGRTE
jgi:oligoendopeptidase F